MRYAIKLAGLGAAGLCSAHSAHGRGRGTGTVEGTVMQPDSRARH
jgi:hypothetical protein